MTYHSLIPDDGHSFFSPIGSFRDQGKVVLSNSFLGSVEGAVGTASYLQVSAETQMGEGGNYFIFTANYQLKSSESPGPPASEHSTLPLELKMGLCNRKLALGTTHEQSVRPVLRQHALRTRSLVYSPSQQGVEKIRSGWVRAQRWGGDKGCSLDPVLTPVMRSIGPQACCDGLPIDHGACGAERHQQDSCKRHNACRPTGISTLSVGAPAILLIKGEQGDNLPRGTLARNYSRISYTFL